jgi:outer membrane protein assembly factor BamB
MVAIDPKTPAVVWEKLLPDVGRRARYSGVMTTPELVFVGAGESLFALAPDTGDVVWSVRLGGAIGSPPTSYAVGGEQYLTVAAGKNVYAFSVPADKDENERAMINR